MPPSPWLPTLFELFNPSGLLGTYVTMIVFLQSCLTTYPLHAQLQQLATTATRGPH